MIRVAASLGMPTACMETAEVTMARVLLLVPARTYRATDFLVAAGRLGLDVVVGSDGALALDRRLVVRVDRATWRRASIGSWPEVARSTRSWRWTPRCWSWRRRWRPAWA